MVEQELENEVEAAGRFRIYLGAMAGVGKTCAMLDEGWRRLQRGTDVAIGLVETHGRSYTASLIREIPVIAQKVVTYRGKEFGEMDTESVLLRHPQVVLVDELAHTNIPGGSPNPKRYQDVLRLLDNGIDVITTLNVQHIESIADAVEKMVGVPIRERVPDWVVKKADQLELIDSSPQQLRRRMLHGNIYPNDKVQTALTNFFTTENLSALRELALRYVADETDENLVAYLHRRHSEKIFETRERVMAGLSLSADSWKVLHRAARMADRAKSDLSALVILADSDITGKQERELEHLRTIASDLGVVLEVRSGSDVASELVKAAFERQITQIVIGASKRNRWEELLHGSIASDIIHRVAGAGIDVHVIGTSRNHGSVPITVEP